jgi:hypothetical protein
MPLTRSEWFEGTNPTHMLYLLGDGISARKRRLFGVACCRKIESLLTADTKSALNTAERFAEGHADSKDRAAARGLAMKAAWPGVPELSADQPPQPFGQAKQAVVNLLEYGAREAVRLAATHAAYATIGLAGEQYPKEAEERNDWYRSQYHIHRERQADLLRHMVGDPFDPPNPIDPRILEWKQRTVPSVARRIRNDRDFDQLAILADALEEAGCTRNDVLNHLRSDEPHMPGCWALDWVLQLS